MGLKKLVEGLAKLLRDSNATREEVDKIDKMSAESIIGHLRATEEYLAQERGLMFQVPCTELMKYYLFGMTAGFSSCCIPTKPPVTGQRTLCMNNHMYDHGGFYIPCKSIKDVVFEVVDVVNPIRVNALDPWNIVPLLMWWLGGTGGLEFARDRWFAIAPCCSRVIFLFGYVIMLPVSLCFLPIVYFFVILSLPNIITGICLALA